MSISIKIDPIPGSDIAEVFGDMCSLSDRLGVMVTATVNGIYLTAYHSTPAELAQRYERSCELKAKEPKRL